MATNTEDDAVGSEQSGANKEVHASNSSTKKGLCMGVGLCLLLAAVAAAVVGGICGSGHCTAEKEPTDAPTPTVSPSATTTDFNGLLECATQAPPVDYLEGFFGLSIQGLHPDINPTVLEAVMRDTYNEISGMCEGVPNQRVVHQVYITTLQPRTEDTVSFLDLNATALLTCTECPQEEPLFSAFQKDNTTKRYLQQSDLLLDQFRNQLTVQINLMLESFGNTPYYGLDVPLFVFEVNTTDVAPVQVVYTVTFAMQNDTLVVQSSAGKQVATMVEDESPTNTSNIFEEGTNTGNPTARNSNTAAPSPINTEAMVTTTSALPTSISTIFSPTETSATYVPEETVPSPLPTSISPTISPTTAFSTFVPTTDFFAAIVSLLKEDSTLAITSGVFEDPSSPEYQAALWLASDQNNVSDMGALSIDNPYFRQRFALACLYYSTGGDNWKLCGKFSPACEDVQWLAPGRHECTWFSVSCNDNLLVDQINFPAAGNNLIGTLPWELSWLSTLQRFLAPENSLQGNLDLAFGGQGLRSLVIPNNHLTGSLPTGILKRNTDLSLLDLSGNMYEGTLPKAIVTATRLTDLQLGNNAIQGTIHPEIAFLSLLINLDVQSNVLSGTIDEEIYRLTRLEYLLLGGNDGLSGTISSSISQLTDLVSLDLSSTNIGGTIPEGLLQLTKLSNLDLEEARFTGTIPESFRFLNASLMDLVLADNSFTGSVPEAFDYLTALELLRIENTLLTGSISERVCRERGLRFQQLATLVVGCVVACDCCDNCIEPNALTDQESQSPEASDITLSHSFAPSTAPEQDNQSPIQPSLTPTSYEESLIEQQILEAFGRSYFDDKSSTQHKTLRWLISEDPFEIQPSAENLLQRYILSYFYLETSQEEGWISCGKAEAGQPDSCYYLFLVDPSQDPWKYAELSWTRWLSGFHECDWAGVTCQDDKVTDINLDGYQLTGTFPLELTKLDYLHEISLTHNRFRGTLPSKLAQMKNLTEIELQANQFTGTIPNEWFASSNITHMNIASNRISGRIPTTIGVLPNLQRIFFQNNQLTGFLPKELFQMTSLKWVFIGDNKLEGALPTEIGQLTNLEFFYTEGNLLFGPLPTEMGRLTRMRELDLHDSLITGTIPDELYRGMRGTANLFDFTNCNLEGTISPLLKEMHSMDWVYYAYNQLTGTIPQEFSDMPALKRLHVQGNQLSGSIPIGLCSRPQVDSVIADCAAIGTGEIPVYCPPGCCEECCNQDTEICLVASAPYP